MHTDPGFPLVVGAGVSVGHRAVLHGCTVEDEVLVGMGAVLLNGSRIGRGSLIAAGAVLLEGRAGPARVAGGRRAREGAPRAHRGRAGRRPGQRAAVRGAGAGVRAAVARLTPPGAAPAASSPSTSSARSSTPRTGGAEALARHSPPPRMDGRLAPSSTTGGTGRTSRRSASAGCGSPTGSSAARALADVYRPLGLVADTPADTHALLQIPAREWPLWSDVAQGLPGPAQPFPAGLLSNVDDDLLARTRAAGWSIRRSRSPRSSCGPTSLAPGSTDEARRLLGPMVHVATSARDVRGALEAGLAVVRLRRPGHELDPEGPSPEIEARDIGGLGSCSSGPRRADRPARCPFCPFSRCGDPPSPRRRPVERSTPPADEAHAEPLRRLATRGSANAAVRHQPSRPDGVPVQLPARARLHRHRTASTSSPLSSGATSRTKAPSGTEILRRVEVGEYSDPLRADARRRAAPVLDQPVRDDDVREAPDALARRPSPPR